MKTEHERHVRSKFRVKIKSLAEEARIIRKEEKRHPGTSWVRASLRRHRMGIVRDEQRSTLLAYAMFKGMPVEAVESVRSRKIDVQAVARILASLASIAKEDALGRVAWWLGTRLAA